MIKHIGIAAVTHQGAALAYQTIALEAQKVMGRDHHPQISLHNHALGDYMKVLEGKGGWQGVADLLIDSSNRLAASGADFIICPDNTVHQAFNLIRDESPIPWLHIADAVAQEAQRLAMHKVAVLGTHYLMEGPVYQSKFDPLGISWEIPSEADRIEINRMIFDELVQGHLDDTSRGNLLEIIEAMAKRGCDGVVLACTELPLLLPPAHQASLGLPILDSTRLLARYALDFAYNRLN